MRFTLVAFVALASVMDVVSGWRILNYSDGGCKDNEAPLPGDGSSECLDIDPSVNSIRFDQQGSDYELNFFVENCPDGIIAETNDGSFCTSICGEGGCYSTVKVDN